MSAKSDTYFLILNLNENNLIYLLLTRRRKSKWILIGIVYWASCSSLSSFVHHVVVDVKLGPQEILFVLTIFSGFIGLCRVSIMYSIWNFWIKNWQDLDLRCQSIQVSLWFFSFLFFLWHFFWQKTLKLHALQRSTLHKQTDFPKLCN